MSEKGHTSVKVAVRIRPLISTEVADDSTSCIRNVPGTTQVRDLVTDCFILCGMWVNLVFTFYELLFLD